jgi:DNA-binding transcriptional regulator YiaG
MERVAQITQTPSCTQQGFVLASSVRRFGSQDITALRERRGWSISDLSKQLGCPVDLVVAWEFEEKFPTKRHTQMLNRLAAEPPSGPED